MAPEMSPFDSESNSPLRSSLLKYGNGLSRTQKLGIAVAGVAIVVGLGIMLRPAKVTAPPVSAAALTVTTTKLTERHLKTTISGVGTVVAWQELTIAAEAPGLRVMQILADEGDDVKAGQVLAKLDGRVLEAQLRQQDAKVAEQRSALKVAQNNQKRAEELVKRGDISAAGLEDRVSTADTAVARLNAAIASREELATRVAQTNIIAPADGHIAKRSILIGDVVASGKEAFRLIRDNRLELDAQIPETDIVDIKEGQEARVSHEGDIVVTGTVRLVAPIVDSKSRLGLAHIALPPNSGLRAGMYARAEITLTDKAAFAVPETAVVWRDTKATVFVLVDDSHVVARDVTIGTRQDGWVEVRQGLAPTDRVVATGAGFLHDGDKVKVVAAVAPEAQANAR